VHPNITGVTPVYFFGAALASFAGVRQTSGLKGAALRNDELRQLQKPLKEKYAEDPVAFVGWVDDQIMEMRVDEKLKKVAPALARGMASDEVHKQLRGMGTPLTGGANGGGALTPDRYYSDPDLRKKLQSTAEGRKQIDDMMARAARG